LPILLPSAKGAVAVAVAVSALVAAANLTAVGAHEGRNRPSTFPFGAPGKAADVDRTIRVEVRDLSFVPDALEVKARETVRFVVVNNSEVDHDFTIGDSKAQSEHRAEMTEMMARMGDMGDMATMHAKHADPNAVFLTGGETKEIVWRFGKAGQIEFGCNVPGHYEAGMKGTITIR
jgi:uncharacterized cupredoxin-like copper-binding protein